MKKVISILLCILLLLSSFSLSVFASTQELKSAKDAVAEYEAQTGEKVETYRYYFLMPDGTNGDKEDYYYIDLDGELVHYVGDYNESWYNELTNTAGIYWWDSGVADPDAWPGYTMEKGDSDSVFYADVPTAVTTIIFNNTIDGGMDKEDPIYYLSHQTVNVHCEYYDPGESDNYPNGTESFDNMIFVVDPDLNTCCEIGAKHSCGGEWYYYYGDGCYGFVKDGDHTNCLRDDHNHNHDNDYSEGSMKDAIAKYEEETGEKVETNRYYFLMPNGENGMLGDDVFADGEYAESWYNEQTKKAGIYWLDTGKIDCEWPGFEMSKGDSDCVFYADVPDFAQTIIFNNYIDVESSKNPDGTVNENFYQTINIYLKDGYEKGYSDIYPDGLDNFYDMIYVIDPDPVTLNGPFVPWYIKEGEWYYYYGDGCYGFVKDGDHTNCLRDDHNHNAQTLMGDVDLDGEISVLDATAIQMSISKHCTLEDEQKLLADLDGDGEISVLDATAIQMIIAKLD